jgi:hypothetical protein
MFDDFNENKQNPATSGIRFYNFSITCGERKAEEFIDK